VLNVTNDHKGVVKCEQYGKSYLVLKDARLRCTLTPEDSANLKSDRLAVLDYYAHVLNEYSDKELKDTITVGKTTSEAASRDSSGFGKMKYKEAQIHGDVRFDEHIERIVADDAHKKDEARLRSICEKHGIQLSWMSEEASRLKSEEIHQLGADAWKEKIRKLEDACSSDDVPAGYCKVGCGRKISPGLRNGKPYSTCCRGCIMGFGHDIHCGCIDASKLGEGLCKNGCGRPISKLPNPKGVKYDTCCRGCTLTGEHDQSCGKDVMDGFCKNGCGRTTAPVLKTVDGKDFKRFDTCCRLCARDKGHDEECDKRNASPAREESGNRGAVNLF